MRSQQKYMLFVHVFPHECFESESLSCPVYQCNGEWIVCFVFFCTVATFCITRSVLGRLSGSLAMIQSCRGWQIKRLISFYCIHCCQDIKKNIFRFHPLHLWMKCVLPEGRKRHKGKFLYWSFYPSFLLDETSQQQKKGFSRIILAIFKMFVKFNQMTKTGNGWFNYSLLLCAVYTTNY